MWQLPSRGWGPWRQEFYSFHSNPALAADDAEHRFGVWRNVWFGRVSSFVFARWPDVWRWFANLPIPTASRRALRRCFANQK
jgi:hypothetical protein